MRTQNSYPVVVTAVDVPGHAEVSDLDQKAVAHQAVAGCQISVNKVLGGQVHHAWGNLGCDVQHLGKAQFAVGLQWLAVHQDHGVWTVCSETDRRKSTLIFDILHWNTATKVCNTAIKATGSTSLKPLLSYFPKFVYFKNLPKIYYNAGLKSPFLLQNNNQININ